jgi:hypothetical protein
MKLKFIPPPKVVPTFNANVHSTGKIGFTIAGAKHFGLTTSKSLQLAVNEDDATDDSIYGVLLDTVDETQGYRIMKAGEYHSVSAKAFFDAINIDYVKKRPSFVVTDLDVNGMKVMKFTKKEINQPNGQK